MLASQIYNLHFPGSWITRHNNAVNFFFSLLYLFHFKGGVLFFVSCFKLFWFGWQGSNVFIVANIDSEFLNLCLGLCWLFWELLPILRFQVSRKLVKHRLVRLAIQKRTQWRKNLKNHLQRAKLNLDKHGWVVEYAIVNCESQVKLA